MKPLLMLLVITAPAWTKDTCLECHAALEGRLGKPAEQFKDDIHAHRGFGCAACHGGDPSSADPKVSMSPSRGFRGVIPRRQVPEMCARCHSDAALIHRFKPQQRVDQLAQYRTSVHGKRLAQGDLGVATCADCHHAHGIREVRDAQSPVHPLRLPETCAGCHADPKHMKGRAVGTAQFAEYRNSVHWKALAERGDLSAPSCATCHGNHGATPPQVKSVAAVCGGCHALLEEMFSRSVHKVAFEQMSAPGCVTCHGKHEILPPSPKMLAGDGSVCASCHESQSKGARAAMHMARRLAELQAANERSGRILARARQSGMEVSEAELRQREAADRLVKARVAVHTFDLAAFEAPVKEGLAIAAETYRSGEEALRERDRRRKGLAFSLAAILVTIGGLWLAIRRVESAPPGELGR
jgi:predicted CXXCH cytochrome family protein